MTLLKTWFPDADFSDPTWISITPYSEITEVLLSGNDLSAEASPIMWLGFRNPSGRILRDVCAKMKWVALDSSDGQLMQFDTASESFRHPHSDMASRMSAYPIEEVIALRNMLVETLQTGDANQLNDFRTRLHQAISDVETSANGVFLSVLDHLRYVVDYPQIADLERHIPSEAAIREIQPK